MSQNETAPNTTTVFASLSSTFQDLLNISPTNAEILVSVLIFIVIGLVGCILYAVISKFINRWTAKTATTLDDEIAATVKTAIMILIGVLVIQYSLVPLSFLEPYNYILSIVFLVIQIILIAFAISKCVNIFIDWITDKPTLSKKKNSEHSVFILKRVISAVIFSIAFLIIILAFKFTGVWEATFATLSISSIVIGIALQSVLGDFFSALYIYFDRPFEIGDYIFIGEHSGTVKNIGILTTRIQLLQGEELIVSNKELASLQIRNFRKLQKRRITFSIDVTYDTPNEKLEKIPQMIMAIIKNVKGVSPQFVNFNAFGEYSLKFFVSYFVHSPDYGKYLEAQQQINLAIREAFESEGIEMAYLKNVTFIKK